MSSTIYLGEFKTGEIPAPLAYTFENAAGAPLAPGVMEAKFNLRPDATAPADATVRNATFDADTSTGTYVWTEDDFPTPGAWFGELWIGNGSNRWASQDFLWIVRASIGPTPDI